MPDYGLKIAESFQTYLKTGDESLIDKYSVKELKTALKLLSPHYNTNELWFRAIEWRIEGLSSLEDRRNWQLKLWLRKVSGKLIAFILGVLCGLLVAVF